MYEVRAVAIENIYRKAMGFRKRKKMRRHYYCTLITRYDYEKDITTLRHSSNNAFV